MGNEQIKKTRNCQTLSSKSSNNSFDNVARKSQSKLKYPFIVKREPPLKNEILKSKLKERLDDHLKLFAISNQIIQDLMIEKLNVENTSDIIHSLNSLISVQGASDIINTNDEQVLNISSHLCYYLNFNIPINVSSDMRKHSSNNIFTSPKNTKKLEDLISEMVTDDLNCRNILNSDIYSSAANSSSNNIITSPSSSHIQEAKGNNNNKYSKIKSRLMDHTVKSPAITPRSPLREKEKSTKNFIMINKMNLKSPLRTAKSPDQTIKCSPKKEEKSKLRMVIKTNITEDRITYDQMLTRSKSPVPKDDMKKTKRREELDRTLEDFKRMYTSEEYYDENDSSLKKTITSKHTKNTQKTPSENSKVKHIHINIADLKNKNSPLNEKKSTIEKKDSIILSKLNKLKELQKGLNKKLEQTIEQRNHKEEKTETWEVKGDHTSEAQSNEIQFKTDKRRDSVNLFEDNESIKCKEESLQNFKLTQLEEGI
jgi:hypothetical protein